MNLQEKDQIIELLVVFVTRRALEIDKLGLEWGLRGLFVVFLGRPELVLIGRIYQQRHIEKSSGHRKGDHLIGFD